MWFIERYFPNVLGLGSQLIESTYQTLYMVVVTALFAGIFGLTLGVILVVVDENGILEKRLIFNLLDKAINVLRSIPFIIMLALIAPFTRFIVGTSIGTHAAIVPLVIGTVPFFARQIQNSLLEVDKGVIEAAVAMGSSPLEIIFCIYLREGLTGIIRVSSLTIINLIGLTTMAGVVGGGGLGNLAISVGYNRFQNDVTLVATLLVLILVFISQAIGNYFVKKTTH